MVATVLKRIAAQMPMGMQQELRRYFFRTQIRGHRFTTDEQEYALLDRFLAPGDWALDIGANVGHYAMRMAELVGARGRVIAFEPVPNTFALLAANVGLLEHTNVSLLNVAASDRAGPVSMQIPEFDDGLTNYYQAQVTTAPTGLTILTMPVDALQLSTAVKLVKIDVEGHELPVLHGMSKLIARDHPVMIVETGSSETIELLNESGYRTERLPGSSNVLCTPGRGQGA